MAATVTNGLTNVTLANNNTGFSVWKRDGTGGTPSAISETDVFIQGTGACSVKVSNQGVALAYGTGGINLSASGTHVYIWANMLAGGLMATRASNGLCIILSSDASLATGSNYSMWAVDGSDTYPGGWVRYVIDVSKTRTTGAGTLNLSSVQHIGMYCDTRPNTAKFDNLVIDRIDYAVAGTGLRVYGTSTTDDLFQDILDADEGTVNNKYGIVTSKEGIIYVRGTIKLGDDVGTNAATLTDINKVIVFESPKYYNGTSEVDAVSTTFQQLRFVGNGTGATNITLGKKVGSGVTASGRNGLTFIQSSIPVTMDFDDGSADSVDIYGTSFVGITGGLSWGTDTTHECIGNSFTACTQFDPVGGINIFDNTFINTADTDAALLWNNELATTNFRNNSFIANTTGAGVEHDGGLILATYALSNQDDAVSLSSANWQGTGQSFTADGSDIYRAYFYLKKTGSPTGTATVKIYAHTGTFGSTGTPTGTALATSDTLDVSTLSTSYALVRFDFPTPYTTTGSTNYFVAIEYSGGDGSNNVQVGADFSTPSHAGNVATTNGSWSVLSGYDLVFIVADKYTFDYQDITFSGNTYDILNSAPANYGTLTVNATDANPSTSEQTNATGNSVSIVNSVSLSIEVQDTDQNPIQNAQTAIYRTSDRAELMNTDTNASGIASASFNYSGDTSIEVRVRKASSGATKYKNFSTLGTITASGYSLLVTLQEDPNNNATT